MEMEMMDDDDEDGWFPEVMNIRKHVRQKGKYVN
jgi:hypothetical protein